MQAERPFIEEEPMAQDSLQRFIEDARSAWGPLNTELAARIRHFLETLTQAPETEDWLAALLRDRPESRELHRDPEHGFMLLAHAGRQGHCRPPHDHGSGWVVYAVQHGEMEMGTFARIEDPLGGARLVKREAYRLRAGECRVYLPGDLHDTRYLSGEILIFRFTSCDLGQEEREGRLRRHPPEG
jgi:hypothetical protein